MSAGADSPGSPAFSPIPSSNGKGASSENMGMEQIRRLLFGAQMEDVDRRFSSQEERVVQKFRDLETETSRKLSALESSARTQIESLLSQLRDEKEARGEQTLGLDKRLSSLADQLAQFQREFLDRLSQESQTLREEMKRRAAEQQSAMETIFSELKNAKVDRNMLSGLFVELATCLNQASTPPKILAISDNTATST
ncbi:MAG TPA: hypothetical protein P5114_01645 [Hyphomicrobiaceae bacterium]|nr:hypothetical protein [Hyphomicrobiaceae bacterium]